MKWLKETRLRKVIGKIYAICRNDGRPVRVNASLNYGFLVQVGLPQSSLLSLLLFYHSGGSIV